MISLFPTSHSHFHSGFCPCSCLLSNLSVTSISVSNFSSFFLPYFSSIWKNWLLSLFSISHLCPSFLVFLLAFGCSFLVSLPPSSKIFIKCFSFSGTLDDLTKVYTFSILSIFEQIVEIQQQKHKQRIETPDYFGSENRTQIEFLSLTHTHPIHW